MHDNQIGAVEITETLFKCIYENYNECHRYKYKQITNNRDLRDTFSVHNVQSY